MAGEVVERAAGGDDVDEPEQRRPQLLIAGGELHRPRVQGAQRLAGARRERGGQGLADAAQLVAHRRLPLSADLVRAHRAAASQTGGVARSIASQPMSRSRSASSAAAPPRSPNSRLRSSR